MGAATGDGCRGGTVQAGEFKGYWIEGWHKLIRWEHLWGGTASWYDQHLSWSM